MQWKFHPYSLIWIYWGEYSSLVHLHKTVTIYFYCDTCNIRPYYMIRLELNSLIAIYYCYISFIHINDTCDKIHAQIDWNKSHTLIYRQKFGYILHFLSHGNQRGRWNEAVGISTVLFISKICSWQFLFTFIWNLIY